ncbi:helix-turn-helix transcriptional regulator [Chengkuizengella sp. SCS-71B]|uniref:helix-turn-helix domain-containing protein n=1 Tax=Chengkuizengella sp. SCS-71B TaxID=3115290 RepID=UPI0032C2119F
MVLSRTSSSLGSLIKDYRNKRGMTFEKLDQLTDVDKGNICRIESGRIKRPNLDNILKIGSILKIPYEEMMEPYIEVEERSDILFTILHELIRSNNNINSNMITKLAKKILNSPTEESLDLVKNLYNSTANIEEPSTKLILYKLIVRHSRAHGIMPYVAKSLLQAYLVERDDFTKLRTTYGSGKGTIEYEDFLTSEERGLMYYKLFVHSYNLCLFEDSIKMGEKALNEEISDISLRRHYKPRIKKRYLSTLIVSKYQEQNINIQK